MVLQSEGSSLSRLRPSSCEVGTPSPLLAQRLSEAALNLVLVQRPSHLAPEAFYVISCSDIQVSCAEGSISDLTNKNTVFLVKLGFQMSYEL